MELQKEFEREIQFTKIRAPIVREALVNFNKPLARDDNPDSPGDSEERRDLEYDDGSDWTFAHQFQGLTTPPHPSPNNP